MSQGSIIQFDTGLGTTFERWALNRLLARLQNELDIHRVLEGPGDGMTGIPGINSLVMGRAGVQVRLLLPDPEQARFARRVWRQYAPSADVQIVDTWDGNCLPFSDGSVDLAWNFNIMPRLEPQSILAEMARVSQKYVLIFVPNRKNYSFWLHRLHHRVADQPWDHGRVDLMAPEPWRGIFAREGLSVRQVFWVDCPWWPDIVDFGQLLADFLPFLKSASHRVRPENRMRWPADALPYYDLQDKQRLEKQLRRHAFVERSSWRGLKKRFAHHVGILARK